MSLAQFSIPMNKAVRCPILSCELFLLVAHPNIDPDAISEALALEPALLHAAGQPVTTPKGGETGGNYAWSKWQYIQTVHNEEKAQEQLLVLLSHLESRESEILALVGSGARAELFFRTANKEHFSIELYPETLGRLSKLGVSFGYEQFNS